MEATKITLKCGNNYVIVEASQEFIVQRMSEPDLLTQLVRNISSTSASESIDETSLEHVWEWFSLHAGQRMQGVHFFLVATTFLTAAFVAALQHHDNHLSIAIGIIGIFITFCFSRLEIRVRELLHAGERAMKPLQARLAEHSGIPELLILDNVEHSKSCWTKYSQVIRILHLTTGLGWLLAAAYAYGTLK